MGEVFQHGTVYMSNISTYPDGGATDAFVFGVIDGDTEANTLKAMNDAHVGLPDIDPSKPSHRVLHY